MLLLISALSMCKCTCLWPLIKIFSHWLVVIYEWIIYNIPDNEHWHSPVIIHFIENLFARLVNGVLSLWLYSELPTSVTTPVTQEDHTSTFQKQFLFFYGCDFHLMYLGSGTHTQVTFITQFLWAGHAKKTVFHTRTAYLWNFI
jgi:hypothetical protein